MGSRMKYHSEKVHNKFKASNHKLLYSFMLLQSNRMKKKFQRKNERADKLKFFINSIRHSTDVCEEESEQTDCSITERNINHLNPSQYLHTVRYILLLAKQHILSPDTTYLATSILDDIYRKDQFFNKYQCSNKTKWWKILAIGILLISSKFNDIYNVTIAELILSCPYVTKQQIVLAEQILVDSLNYHFPQQTPYTIFYEHSLRSNTPMKTYCSLFEKVFKNEITENINCNIIAKAVVFHYDPEICIEKNQRIKQQIKNINEFIKKLI